MKTPAFWYKPSIMAWVLWPLSLVFAAVAHVRRHAYKSGVLKTHKVPKPVVVIGNITAGGSGKTPCVMWLAESLKGRGLKVGIISRGYGGRAPHYPLLVTDSTDVSLCGDEPKLLATTLNVPVIVDPKRVRAAQAMASMNVDVIISDDGLQHWALGRDISWVVVHGEYGLGNGKRLPAGPLRENAWRLQRYQAVITRGPAKLKLPVNTVTMHTSLKHAISLTTGETRLLNEFKQPVHAVAGIGHPKRFFEDLRGEGLEVIEHVFGDHADLTQENITFDDDYPVLMTDKDAIKCQAFADERAWRVPLEVSIEETEALALIRPILEKC